MATQKTPSNYCKLLFNKQFSYINVFVGSYQRPFGQDMYVSVGQSTASKIITEVTNVINEHLAPLYIRLPTKAEQRETTRSYVL